MFLHTALLTLLTAVAAYAASWIQFGRSNRTQSLAGSVEVTAPSAVGCALRCSLNWTLPCGGFTFRPGGTCVLHVGTAQGRCIRSAESPPMETAAGEEGETGHVILVNSACSVLPTFSSGLIVDTDSDFSGEFSMVDCNHRNSDHYNNMMVGIQDNEGFVDLDTIKCASFANIMVGPDHVVTITAQTDVFQNCGANQVITGLGSSTYYTQDVIRMTCSDVSGATVSDNCTDLTITEEMQSGELDPQLTWPVQCPDGTPRMGAMVGINFRDDHTPKWTGIRCCYLV